MTLRIELDDPQTKAWDMLQPGNTVTLPWGRGAGKSYFARTFLHQQALGRNNIHIGILYPSLKQARQVIWAPYLFADYEGDLKHCIRRLDRTLLEAIYVTGSRVTTWGAENAGGIRGQRFDVIIQDEADDIDPSIEHAIVEPTMSRSGRSAIWLKTGTFRRGRHGVLFADYQRAIQGKDGYKTLRVRSCESPQVDQEWLKRVKEKTPASIFAREYDVDPDSIEGLVYPFDEQFHVREPPPHFVFNEYIAGVDHGWTDPGVILLLGIHGHGNDAIAWILDEHYETELPNHEWDKRAKRWDTLVDTFWCDPSRPDRIRDLRNAGCNARAADNDIQAGVGRVADLLFKRTASEGTEWARLYVHPRCTNTIWEFQNYRRKRDPADRERYLEAIQDKSNHSMDSARYALISRFGRIQLGRVEVPGR